LIKQKTVAGGMVTWVLVFLSLSFLLPAGTNGQDSPTVTLSIECDDGLLEVELDRRTLYYYSQCTFRDKITVGLTPGQHAVCPCRKDIFLLGVDIFQGTRGWSGVKDRVLADPVLMLDLYPTLRYYHLGVRGEPAGHSGEAVQDILNRMIAYLRQREGPPEVRRQFMRILFSDYLPNPNVLDNSVNAYSDERLVLAFPELGMWDELRNNLPRFERGLNKWLTTYVTNGQPRAASIVVQYQQQQPERRKDFYVSLWNQYIVNMPGSSELDKLVWDMGLQDKYLASQLALTNATQVAETVIRLDLWALSVYCGCLEVLPVLERSEQLAGRINAHSPLVWRGSSMGDTMLIVAAGIGLEDTVKWLLAHGADVNATNALGQNALRVATKPKVVDLLLNAGAVIFINEWHAPVSGSSGYENELGCMGCTRAKMIKYEKQILDGAPPSVFGLALQDQLAHQP